MRVSIQATILCAFVCVGVGANQSAAQGPAGVRVATATPAVVPVPKFTFILFWKENNPTTQSMHEALKQAVAQRSQRAEWISVNITDGSQRPLVRRVRIRPDHGDRAVGVVLADAFRRHVAGHPGADDQVLGRMHLGLFQETRI